MFFEMVSPQTLVWTTGACFVAGYLVINQIVLRALLFLGSLLYLWYYFVAAEEPLWDAISMSLLMIAANILGYFGLWLQHQVWIVPRRHRDIYPRFSSLPPGDFRNLVRKAERVHLSEKQRLTVEGGEQHRLFYVVRGVLDVEKQGERFSMPAGVFVGEVAYVNQTVASATTWVDAGAELLVWKMSDLRAMSSRSSRFKLALEAMLTKDLARKVAFSVAPRATQTPEASWRCGPA
jgi:hypothetical protein